MNMVIGYASYDGKMFLIGEVFIFITIWFKLTTYLRMISQGTKHIGL
jgi:hypothetical protein